MVLGLERSCTRGLVKYVSEKYNFSIFNDKDNLQLPAIYGAITTGSNWKFLKYKDNTAFIDLDEYSIENTKKVVGILLQMISQEA